MSAQLCFQLSPVSNFLRINSGGLLKIMEQILLAIVMRHLENRELIWDNQPSFTKAFENLVPHQNDFQLQQISEPSETKSKTLTDKRAHVHVAEQLRAQNFQEEQRAQD